MPLVSGGAFTGGRISRDLQVNGDGSIGAALTVQGDANKDAVINATSAALAGDYLQAFGFSSATFTMVSFATDGQYDFYLTQADTNGLRVVNNNGSAFYVRVYPGGFLNRFHAAPPDADLAAGDMAIWFDQTNGAGKLMVKAKTQNGSVVSGSLALA